MSEVKQMIAILGSTGSIGLNTLKVIADHRQHYEIFALTANTSVELIFRQCQEFQPAYAVMAEQTSAQRLGELIAASELKTEVLSGIEGLQYVAASREVDCVVAAIVGGAGLLPSLAAVSSGKKVLLANKEALVMAGDLFMTAIEHSGAKLLPVDSEHNAIFQCLPINSNGKFVNEESEGFEKIVLTASGGPFLNMPVAQMQDITPDQACNHPNWKMGPKISVDSASMMNKALELIEASFLFNIPMPKIDIVIHPQSIVHSMVYYRDGSVLAQMGNPDMRTPISHGLAWPKRISAGVKSLDLVALGKLEFYAPDEDRFPALKLGRQAAQQRGTAPVVLNAANEVAVKAFLEKRISFIEIPVIIAAALSEQEAIRTDSIETVLEEDRKARQLTEELIQKSGL